MSLLRSGSYMLKTIAEPIPSSANDKTVIILLNNPLTPKYSALRIRTNIIRTTKFRTKMTIWLIIEDFKFNRELFTRDIQIIYPIGYNCLRLIYTGQVIIF
jgi:hypothetical protein